MKRFTDLASARAAHEQDGGYLLHLGDGEYLTTDDANVVADFRSPAFLAECEDQQEWDETKLKRDA